MDIINLSQVRKVLCAVLVAQVIFCLVLGVLMPVPLAVIGIGQLIPAILVLVMAPNFRRELLNSLSRLGSKRSIAGVCLFTALVILICCAVAYSWGDQVQDLNTVPSLYPFVDILPSQSLVGFFIFLLLVGPLIHLVNATGEEVFWRGYLLTGLNGNFGEQKAVFLSGLFWGIWHIPMVVFMNWVFPQALLGSILFTIAMITWGYVLSYIRLRADSLWPPILMHATANAFVIGAYDSIATPELNIYSSPWGILGIALTLPIALFLHIRILRRL